MTIVLPVDVVAAIAAEAAALVEVQPASVSPYMTVPEAADYLRCSRQRVYDLLSAGRLTRHKDGRRVLVFRAEADALLAGSSGVAPRLPTRPQPRMDTRPSGRGGNT